MVVTKIEYLLTLREGGSKGNRRRYSMSDFQKLAHAVWQCKYHIIWCPKYRFKIVRGALQRSVGEILQQLCDWKKLDILEMNIQEDHVHMVLSIPPRFSVSEVVGFLKGKCAIKIFDKHLELKKRYWGRHFWAKGYCVSTVGLDEEKVCKYVKWQRVKDKRMEQLKLWK
jgi:putative transposase